MQNLLIRKLLLNYITILRYDVLQGESHWAGSNGDCRETFSLPSQGKTNYIQARNYLTNEAATGLQRIGHLSPSTGTLFTLPIAL